jgi:hypothetical protein
MALHRFVHKSWNLSAYCEQAEKWLTNGAAKRHRFMARGDIGRPRKIRQAKR